MLLLDAKALIEDARAEAWRDESPSHAVFGRPGGYLYGLSRGPFGRREHTIAFRAAVGLDAEREARETVFESVADHVSGIEGMVERFTDEVAGFLGGWLR